jgi:phytoene dehydrogenase-like protein
MARHYHTAIVGGGLAGLLAACDLARSGVKTVVLEAAREPGGRARTRKVDGFRFNQGPHALYLKGTFRAALDSLGIQYSGRKPAVDNAVTLWKGQKHPFPTGLGSLLHLTPLGWADRLQVARLLMRIVRGDYHFAGQSLSEVMHRFRPRVRQLFEALTRVTTYVNAPADIDAHAVFNQIRLSLGGVIYLDDGWGSVVSALATVAITAGTDVMTECRVTSLSQADSRWRVGIAGREDISADTVILAVEPGECARLVDRSANLRDALRTMKPAKVACLDIALSKLPHPTDNFALGIDEAIYFSVHSKAARLAPEGSGLVHAMRYLAPTQKGDLNDIERLENLFDLMQPGWRALEVHRQRLIGMTVAHDIPQARNSGRRTPAILDDTPGLFLAGDWVGSQGMLSDAATASAKFAAKAACMHLGTAAKETVF